MYKHVSFMRICDCSIFRILPHFRIFQQSVHITCFFSHELSFSTAMLIFFVFLLPISITFCYLNHLFANRMAPSTCPDPCGMRWVGFKQFCTIFPPHIWCSCGSHIFLKCRMKPTCLNMEMQEATESVVFRWSCSGCR